MAPTQGRPALLQLSETVLELVFSFVPFTDRQANVHTSSVPVLETVVPLWPSLEAALAVLVPALEFLKLGWSSKIVVGDWLAGAAHLHTLALVAQELEFTLPLTGLTALTSVELSTVENDELKTPAIWLPGYIERVTLIPCPNKRIPEQVLQLPKLTHLDVSETYFGPGDIGSALIQLGSRLTSLALDETDTSLPPQLSLLSNLRVLSLDSCPFSATGLLHPACPLTSLRKLACLSLSNNGMPFFPPAVLSMSSLQNLYLENNRFLQLGVGPYLSSLRNLYLENNRFLQLGVGPYLSSLRVLSLDWQCAFGSIQELSKAASLRELALGRPVESDFDGVIPHLHLPQPAQLEHSASALLDMFTDHPSLKEVLLLSGFVGAPDKAMLEVLLSIGSCRPDLRARAVRRSEYFVADPEPEREPGDAAEARITV
ncbi:hypothetical protein N2152v2_000307 [Parachlorella kessleri]